MKEQEIGRVQHCQPPQNISALLDVFPHGRAKYPLAEIIRRTGKHKAVEQCRDPNHIGQRKPVLKHHVALQLGVILKTEQPCKIKLDPADQYYDGMHRRRQNRINTELASVRHELP